jgi:hypothetical protein
MDLDADLFLDPAEFTGSKTGKALTKALKAFAKLDANDDSQISMAEALGGKRAAAVFSGVGFSGLGPGSPPILLPGLPPVMPPPAPAETDDDNRVTASWAQQDLAAAQAWLQQYQSQVESERRGSLWEEAAGAAEEDSEVAGR